MMPLSFVVVVSGMILLLVSWVPYVNLIIGRLVWGAVCGMNTVVAWVEGLPFSFIKGLYVSEFEFAMLLLALFLLLLLAALRKRRLVIGMLSAVMLFMVSVTVRLYQSDDQRGMTVFCLRNHTAVDFVRGREHVLLADSALMEEESTVDYSLAGAWAKQFLSLHPEVIGFEEDFEGTYLRKRSNLIAFDGKLLALWDGSRLKDSLSYRMPVDYLLVRGKQKPDLQSIVNGYDLQTLLIDGSVPDYLAERWVSQAREMALPYINIGDGAVEIEE